MIKGLLILLIAAAIWLPLLWFAIAPDLRNWSHLPLLAIHAAPPLVVWLGWWLVHRRNKKRSAEAATQREQEAEAERLAALDAVRRKHAAELRQRRFNCDCRAVSIASLGARGEMPLLNEEVPGIVMETRDTEPAESDGQEDILDLLQPALASALGNLYSMFGAAAGFPIYLLPPAEVSGEEVILRVRALQQELAQGQGLSLQQNSVLPPVLFLPNGDSAANSVLSLFETTPDLPGATVLAFDSPMHRAPPPDDGWMEEPDPETLLREKQLGQPSEGVFAMLFTNAALPSMLDAIAGTGGNGDDSLTPFWDKALQPGGSLALLARMPSDLRQQLADEPPLARLHRAAFTQVTQKQHRVLELTRTIQTLLERAQVNAGMIEPPPPPELTPANDSADAKPDEAPACGWLVHNAGGVDYAGNRLAALGTAMLYFKIDLNPVEMATNIATRIGDLGRASPIAMLALTVAHAAACRLPALCSEFHGQDGIALAFAMPAEPV